MKIKLRYKLILSYILIAIISIVIVALIGNALSQTQFRKYVLQQREHVNQSVVNDMKNSYKAYNKWNINDIEHTGKEALDKGLIITVKDSYGKSIWDARKYNSQECEFTLDNMNEHMMMYFPNWKGKYTTKEYNITLENKKVGTLYIGSYPDYYSDNDILYLKILNNILIYSVFIALLVAIILGLLVTNNIVRPISKVVKSTKNISRGNYNERIYENVDTIELNDLIIGINNLAQSLQKQEDIRKNLTKDISHELKTPLTSLQINLEALIDGILEPTTERLSICYEEILRLTRLVKDLEKLYMYEQNDTNINKTEFNIEYLIKNVITNFESECKRKNINISFNSNSLIINADKDKITQVIINLLSNAIKYTHEGGNIFIETYNVDNGIKLVIEDNGIGISEEDLPYIFERFYRSDKSRTRLTGGAGIGLSIAKAIINSHNGIIDVESKIGQGTKFILYIPN